MSRPTGIVTRGMNSEGEVVIRLSAANRRKLFALIKERDEALHETYEMYLGVPFPFDSKHVHHVRPVGSGGEDKEENLISLSPEVHLQKFHTGWGSVNKEYQRKAEAYLESEEVRRWREENEEGLTALYRTAEITRIQKIRKGCLPEKRPGLPF